MKNYEFDKWLTYFAAKIGKRRAGYIRKRVTQDYIDEKHAKIGRSKTVTILEGELRDIDEITNATDEDLSEQRQLIERFIEEMDY